MWPFIKNICRLLAQLIRPGSVSVELGSHFPPLQASLVAQLVKNPPAMWETWVQSLGWEDPLEKGKAPHSTALAWRIPWTVQSTGHRELDTAERLSLHFPSRSTQRLQAWILCVSCVFLLLLVGGCFAVSPSFWGSLALSPSSCPKPSVLVFGDVLCAPSPLSLLIQIFHHLDFFCLFLVLPP